MASLPAQDNGTIFFAKSRSGFTFAWTAQAPGGFMHEEEAIAASTAVESVVPSAAVLSNLGERPQQVSCVGVAVFNIGEGCNA